ncbi:hypothetical protein ACFL35_13670 [Candidatus Riflebacteria bacterium]
MFKKICLLLFLFLTICPGIRAKDNGSSQEPLKLHSISLNPMQKVYCATPNFFDATKKYFSGKALKPLTRKELEKRGRKFDREGNIVPEIQGQMTEFWAINVGTNQFERIPATLARVTQHAYLYVENGKNISEKNLNRIAEQFDNQIYPRSKDWFGDERNPGIDFDPRITLLFLDIQDGWEPGKGYVGGYFYPLNEVSTRIFPQSNEREMFYLDLHPSDPNKDDFLGILGHEFHHLIHWSHDPLESKWLNEGCAQLNFYVTGYGHPSQIFAFLPRPDKQLTKYETSVVDYGVSYLWFYYLYSKYAGENQDSRKNFFRKLVDSKEKSVQSINTLLAQYGHEKDFEKIFKDWSIANIINAYNKNPLLGYDKTLNFTVYDTATHYQFPAEVKDKTSTVTVHGNDYIRITDRVLWEPRNPIFYGKVKVYATSAGNVHWTINNKNLPEADLLPAGSQISADGKVAITPLSESEDGRYFAEFGPFHKGERVDTLNYQIKHADSESAWHVIKIINKDFSQNLTRAQKGKLVIDFQGKKGGVLNKKAFFVVQAVGIDSLGKFHRKEMTLDEKHKGSLSFDKFGSHIKEVILMPSARGKKALKYSYKIRIESEQQAASLKLARYLHDIRIGIQKELKNGGKNPEKLRKDASALLHLEDQLTENIVKKGTRLAAKGLDSFKTFVNELKQNKGHPVTKQVTGQIKTRLSGELLAKLEDGQTEQKGDDTAHENWGYLLFKLGENVHALTHLKIDPDMLEGQILDTYKLLKIMFGLPDLPIPDGLGIVDYNATKLNALVEDWKNKKLDSDKESCKRLFIATFMVEAVYNNSLSLVDDTMKTVVEAAEMIWQSHNTLKIIASGFKDVPIVGDIATRVRYLIISKSLRLADGIIWVISPHISVKYQKYMPIASIVILNVLPHILGIDPEKEKELPYKSLIQFVVKTVAKYAVTSIPKIGYVARTQPHVDLAAEYAGKKDISGTLDEANALMQNTIYDLKTTTIKKKELAEKERKIANVTNKIFQIARLGMVIDPTNISKVVSLVAVVATGGLLSHAAYSTGSYYFKHPGFSLNGVKKAFHPDLNPDAESARDTRLWVSRGYIKRGVILLDTALNSYNEFLEQLKITSEKKDIGGISDLLTHATKKDAELEGNLTSIQTMALAAASSNLDRRVEKNYRNLIQAVTVQKMSQADLYSRILTFAARPDNAQAKNQLHLSIEKVQKQHQHLQKIAHKMQQWAPKRMKRSVTIEYIQSPYNIRMGQQKILTAYISNYSNVAVENIRLELVTNGFTRAERKVYNLKQIPAYSWRKVNFIIEAENIDRTKDGALLLMLEADGAPLCHRTLFIEAIK